MSQLAPRSVQTQRPELAMVAAPWHEARQVARPVVQPQAPGRQAADTVSETWADVQVQDTADGTPRRRATDAGMRPGFPASGFVAQVLAQQAFPPDAVTSNKGLAAYQATLQRGRLLTGPGVNLYV